MEKKRLFHTKITFPPPVERTICNKLSARERTVCKRRPLDTADMACSRDEDI